MQLESEARFATFPVDRPSLLIAWWITCSSSRGTTFRHPIRGRLCAIPRELADKDRTDRCMAMPKHCTALDRLRRRSWDRPRSLAMHSWACLAGRIEEHQPHSLGRCASALDHLRLRHHIAWCGALTAGQHARCEGTRNTCWSSANDRHARTYRSFATGWLYARLFGDGDVIDDFANTAGTLNRLQDMLFLLSIGDVASRPDFPFDGGDVQLEVSQSTARLVLR